MQNDWFDDDCPLCRQLKNDIEKGLVEQVDLDLDLEETESDRASNHVWDLIEADLSPRRGSPFSS